MGKPKAKRTPDIPTLDLHGAVIDEVFDLMDRFLRREEASGADRVRILHGRGTGKVKEKALEYCRLAGHSPEEDKTESPWGNPGSFLLYL
ncbi:MAG TPA: Smr/MutS family protein [Bdellovibrionota bacterium]|jgi:dsDNA-specific endonuclease/ATPase MutS2